MPTVRVLGIDLHYEAPRGVSSVEGEMVLLVHGFGGSARHFELLMPRLMPYVHPIALDLPGHGRSGGTIPSCMEDFVEYLVEFLRAIGVDKPLCYLGHSLGGLIGLQFYLQHPELIRALVFVASSSRVRLHPDLLGQAKSGTWDVETFRPAFTCKMPEPLQCMVLNDLMSMKLSCNCDAIANWSTIDLSPVLGKVSVPVLVTVPQDDVIISPRKGRMLAAKIPTAKLRMIPDAGHYVHVEQPAVVAQELNLFLSALRDQETESIYFQHSARYF